MKIGVISDTHDQCENILKAVKLLNQEKVELVIHCGDWISPFTLKFYKNLKSPIKGVFGNNDGDRFYHLKYVENLKLDITFKERVLNLILGKRKILAYHGDYGKVTEELISSGKYDAIFHGHTHISVNKIFGKTLSLNPGTFMPFTDNQIKGASFAIYESRTNSAKLIKL
ncbi:hypothetical protein A2160_04545 [Candidatus Beckwithbacteria bacterium RBG_13_42_9]|uniref:Phosphoesterase n=1 Tax=Candidatus Beckwithbacteria bacterium RBG_13_42_9 TaxID=1797457 RepID=A0A1F5E9K2_9BACT|nr:MAG: hypothetical protein A2160_04545 [Candidatus Beckwithbacteria bacterium RBG_13_42_9]